jgi:hypothetical protein
MVTTQIINDAASLQRLGMLAEQMTKWEFELAAIGEDYQARGDVYGAVHYRTRAARCGRVAGKARDTLVRLSGLTESDVQPAGLADLMSEPEPPSTLVGLTDWLRGKLGRWFPHMPSEIWQGVALVLHHHRRPS